MVYQYVQYGCILQLRVMVPLRSEPETMVAPLCCSDGHFIIPLGCFLSYRSLNDIFRGPLGLDGFIDAKDSVAMSLW